MKKISTHLTLLSFAFVLSVSGCSSNTQNENTAVGAGTGAVAGGLLGSLAKGSGSGWVIAAGAAVGALVGGVIGHHMDSTDSTSMYKAMDNNSINQPSNWKNDKTGVWYKIVPTSDVMSYKGSSYCRHYVAYGKSDGKSFKTKGIACRSQDGKWYQVRR